MTSFLTHRSCRFPLAAVIPTLAIVASVGVVGCSAKSSSSLATNQISAFLRVEVDDDIPKTRFSAIFSQDITTDVRLEDGDNVAAMTDKDARLPLMLGNLSVYSVEIPQIDRTTATFNLSRASGTQAPSSTVAIPPSLMITAPAAMTNVPYAGGTGKLMITWTNKVDGAKVVVNPDPCDGAATTTGTEVADTGSYEIATKDLIVGIPTAPACIVLFITRRIVGQTDPAYKSGSSLEASRVVKLKVQVTP
jgi:hypothetical protein